MDEISIEGARPKLGEIVDKARLAEDYTMITRQGKPAAVVVSYRFLLTLLGYIGIEDPELAEWRDVIAAIREGRRQAGLRPIVPQWVSHIDGDARNNDVSNLRIVDAPEENER